MADKDDTKFTGFVFNEDAQVVDVAAQRALARERRLADTPANDRPASFDAAGTPEYMEQNTPDHVHSDGGSTVWNEKTMAEAKLLAPDDAKPAEKNELKEEAEDLSDVGGGRKDKDGPSAPHSAPHRESAAKEARETGSSSAAREARSGDTPAAGGRNTGRKSGN